MDVEDARAVEGFVEWLDHNDIPGVNNCSTGRFAEEIFCSGEVHYAGQCIGAVVATSSNAASEAAKKVSDVLRTTLRSRVARGTGKAWDGAGNMGRGTEYYRNAILVILIISFYYEIPRARTRMFNTPQILPHVVSQNC